MTAVGPGSVGPGSTGPPAPAASVGRGSLMTRSAAPAGDRAISTRSLTKRFPSGQVAVDGVDLDVPHGSVYGFLGPNGSGKTTTIRMLLGLVAPTSGTPTLLGRPIPGDAARVLPRVGALVEGPSFHPYLSGAANLRRLDAADRSVRGSSSRRRVADALDRVGLGAAAGKRYRSYSLGMRQRLGLAGALLRPRELFVLDEPTNGLDPQGTREVRALVREVGAEGATVFLSSHLLSEIEQVATHVGVMSHGRLVFSGAMAELRAAAGVQLKIGTPDTAAAATVLARLGMVSPATGPDVVTAELGSVAVEDVAPALVAAGVRIQQLVVDRPDLEDVFVSLTGEGFDVDQ